MYFILNFLEIQGEISSGKDIHKGEIAYLTRKRILPSIERKYKTGKISEKDYREWIVNYKALEDKYG